MLTRCGIPSHLYTKPLTYGLERNPQAIDLHVDLSSLNALRLKSRELDIALLSPIDYARNSGEYRVVPDLCVNSRTSNHTILLHFKEGLRRITTVAADIGSTSELVLAKIILSEKYDSNPQFLPMKPDLTAMLGRADAALLVGGMAPFMRYEQECTIDLVEEWTDVTNLPYVHALWVTRDERINPSVAYLLKQSHQEGLRHLAEIASAAADENNLDPARCESYLSSFGYFLDGDAMESLSEFYRYGYYYGVLGEIPEIHLLNVQDESDIRLN
jgi:chorismate dehydratase